MRNVFFTTILFGLIAVFTECSGAEKIPVPGAYQIGSYIHLLEGKSIAIAANQTSMVGKTHLVDTLTSLGVNISLGVNVVSIFSPEHGFREL